jgi:hypothetical protein
MQVSYFREDDVSNVPLPWVEFFFVKPGLNPQLGAEFLIQLVPFGGSGFGKYPSGYHCWILPKWA